MIKVADKRNVERFDLDLKAIVSVFDDTAEFESLAMQTRDVSADGAFLLTNRPLSVGTRVQVEMVLPLDDLKKIGDKALIKTSGKVLRMEADGMAICFDSNSKILPFAKEKKI
jgi:c-di-GMP-binding flagellar brake protein YcgR